MTTGSTVLRIISLKYNFYYRAADGSCVLRLCYRLVGIYSVEDSILGDKNH